jgi:hypothetical protein
LYIAGPEKYYTEQKENKYNRGEDSYPVFR